MSADNVARIPVARAHLEWLMREIEDRCRDKVTANLVRIHGRFDLQLEIVVAEQDRGAITDEFIVDAKRTLREKTGLEPVIYLQGEEPSVIREPDPY